MEFKSNNLNITIDDDVLKDLNSKNGVAKLRISNVSGKLTVINETDQSDEYRDKLMSIGSETNRTIETDDWEEIVDDL